MKKRFLSLLLIIGVLFTVAFAMPATVSAAMDGIYTYTVSNGEATITDCKASASGKKTIPSKLGGYPVTIIGDSAFYNCAGLTSVTIPNSVKTIGYNAFCGCESLTSVTIPNSVKTIDWGAFQTCKSLASVTIPDSVITIGSFAFSNCTGLTSVTIPDSVTTISMGAFRDCTGLTSVTIGKNVTTIGDGAFKNCTGLTSIIIPDSVTTIDGGAFRDCTGLTQINWNAKNVAGFYHYYDDDDSIFYNAGTNGSGIKVVFGNEVESIPAYAFYNCTGITSVTIPNSVTTIGNYSFYNCGYSNNADNWENGYLYINNHLIDTDKTITMAEVREGTITIAAGAFQENTELLRITLPDTLKSISDYAFYGCSNLLKITIPENVSYIGGNAFYNCNNIIKINIPSKVTEIGYDAFEYCNSLEGVYITDINAWCKIEFGNYNANPLNYAQKLYINNELAENIYITENITTLNDYAFYNCNSIKIITLPESITTIGLGAFYNCNNLQSINIPASVTNVGTDAFYWCDNLKKVYITDLSAWCKMAFENDCANPLNNGGYLYLNGKTLEALEIPDDITVLNSYAFYNCDSIKSVVFHDNFDKIEESAFYDCDKLECVVVPKDLFYIKNNAFYGCNKLSYVLFKGSQALWDDMLIYSGNDPLHNATLICNLQEKTYKFETNCDSTLSDIKACCLVEAPKPYNEFKALEGWYDNATFSGNAITFPYYGDAITLYAKWTKRTGESFDTALCIKENEVQKKIFTWDKYVYYEFVPKFSGEYVFYETYDNVYLYDQNRNSMSISDPLEAGKVYYLVGYSYYAGERILSIKPYKAKGTMTNASGDGSFTVSVNGVEIGNEVILALYNGDTFVGLGKATYKGEKLYFITSTPYTEAKVMVWNSISGLKPVSTSEEIH